ncbi:metal-dependent hydrolase [Vibrio sagamiensis NBRC 104589]|uniref:Metal-dependent hydrolase n=2 Tax=Vibrio sagamiensis TaxID=512650 RepID=A0A511QGU4_9VIBR|nr:metal-dependent hydrolase [Vibrio sagamiensis NBRC 104589]
MKNMSITATKIRFCHQVWQLETSVQQVQSTTDMTYVITETTPFHPVSHIWPDHPADRGSLMINGKKLDVIDCQVGAIELASGALHVGQAIPVKRDTQGWVFVVVHVLPRTEDVVVGDMVSLQVDKEFQLSLSRGHSAGHIAYLALNKVLTQNYWRKDADRKDPHGNYDFNSYAQETSFVTPDKCLDTYRLGKTLRKRGLNSAEVVNDLESIENQVNLLLKGWIQRKVPVTIQCHGEALTDSRYWECDLGEENTAVIPCGGTHITHLNELESVKVRLLMQDTQTIEMHTHVVPQR